MCDSGVVLTAATVPQIMQGLKKITCSQGKAARFEAVIHGQPTPEITWFDYYTLSVVPLSHLHV